MEKEKLGGEASNAITLFLRYKTKNPDSAMNRDFEYVNYLNYNTSFTSLYGNPKASETPL